MKKVTLLCLFVLSAMMVQAQAKISFQGILKKNSTGGAVEDGAYDITFQLYEIESSGAPIWSETQTGVNVIGGVYSVLLGEVVPLAIPFDKSYFLGMSVNGAAELIPRIALTAAPYALSLLGSSNVFPNDGNVGVGTIVPEEKLHVIGNLKIEGDLEVSGATPQMDLSNLTQDVNTTGNMTLGSNLNVPGAVEQLSILRGEVGNSGSHISGTGFSVVPNPNNVPTVINFDTPFSAIPTVVATSRTNNIRVSVTDITTTSCTLSGAFGPNSDFTGFSATFIVIGLR